MRSALSLIALVFTSIIAPQASAADDPEVAFFEQKIRPVLVKECYSCHSVEAKKLKGGLRLDSKAGLLTGGDTGPSIVPGKPNESLLIAALKYNDLEMPPKGKLPDTVVNDFTRWVEHGAVDPRTEKPKAVRASFNIEAGRKFWSYQPLQLHDKTKSIDGWINDVIATHKLKPAPQADRTSLIRRLTYDLTGLPPTVQEIDAFAHDTSPKAYENLVDRLLASPRFGERWARHWFDIVRFAESITLRGTIFKEAWRYRDFVIDAFNSDMSYQQFLREQIAGDLLPASTIEDQRRQRIATAFLVLGNNNLEEQDKNQLRMDVVDEQIDVIGKAILGQTIACARCHDHKFDPIPTRDYYALAGILRNAKALETANVSKWIEVPLPMSADREAEIKKQTDKVASLESKIKSEQARLKIAGTTVAKGVVDAKTLPGLAVDDSQAKRVGSWTLSKHNGSYIGEGYLHDGNSSKGEKSLTFQPEIPAAGVYEIRLAYTPGSNRASAVPVTILSADGEKVIKIDEREDPPIDGRFISLGRHRFEKSGQGYVLVANEGTNGHVIADAVVFLPVDSLDTKSEGKSSKGQDKALRDLEAQLKKLKDSGPDRDMSMSVLEESDISDTRIHVRGSVHTLGETAPRGFLRVASKTDSFSISKKQSGRRELADWLTSAANPLTARVYVNRVWHWLIGTGLVRTPDNFGTTGELPSHPELLDELTLQFIDQGWSVKRLIRSIVLSETYRRASADNPVNTTIDPENRWLARANRRRLEAESLRDTMLAVSGQLTLGTKGPTYPKDLTADYGYKGVHTCRSIFVPVFRNALPDIFEVFDFADPSMVVGRRDLSTVAPQALFLLNNPFVIEQSQQAAKTLLASPELDDHQRITRAYRTALGRPPTDPERKIAARIIKNENGYALLFQTLFGSLDFRYID
jgi:hypothetical protein